MLQSPYGRVALVTGATSGIGLDIATRLAAEGLRVYGTSRRPMAAPPTFEWLPADITSDASVRDCVDEILSREGRIDILVNCAGAGICGSIEETPIADARFQLDVCFFGALRMIQAVLPGMRERGVGLIVNIGSVAGIFPIPFQGFYSSAKFALDAMTETLRMELTLYPLVNATLIEPGDIKTGFTADRRYCPAPENSAYRNRYQKAVAQMEKDELGGMSPAAVTACVLRAIRSKNPPVRITVGFTYKLFTFLKRLLPARLVESILVAMYPGRKE